MQETAIQAGAPVPAPSAPTAPPMQPVPAIKKRTRGLPYRVLEFCASLRITVVLFLLAFFLVFFGTWAQVDAGIWTVVNKYFRWWFVWIPFRVLLFRTVDIPEIYGIPFPGGWTLGALLLINLLAAHAIRFRLAWKRAGILILHSGLILMMLGEFYTGVFAIEGRMTIVEGYASNFVDSDRRNELAIVERTDPKVDDEVVIPQARLKDGNVIKDADLPFDVEVVRYMVNSDMRRPRDKDVNPATAGIGLRKIAVPKQETAGVDPDQHMEIASAYVHLKKKNTGESLGTHLVSTWFSVLNRRPDTVKLDGKEYQLSLRPKRSYKNYAIKLNKFQHKKFVGTEVAKDFRSFVTLIEPDKKENRDVEIYMNHPLYYREETFYQASLHPLAKGTVLQVVHNWAWAAPYYACGLVAGGMLIHFGTLLVNFLGVHGFGIFAGSRSAGAIQRHTSPKR